MTPPLECFVVEGDSAAKSVDRVRDKDSQAILALQGKPLNAARASEKTAAANVVFLRIAHTLSGDSSRGQSDAGDPMQSLNDPTQCAYQKIVLLMDPDADGIHCGVLMMGFFRQFAPNWIHEGRLSVVHPPMYVFRLHGQVDSEQTPLPVASSPEHAARIEDVLHQRGLTGFIKTRHRGLGSLDATVLRRCCIDPATRREDPLTIDDVEHALHVFGSKSM